MATHGATAIIRRGTTGQTITSGAPGSAIDFTELQVDTASLGTWWSAGSPSQIEIPWSGPYMVTLEILWDENATGNRMVYLNQGTTVSTANFRAGAGIGHGEATEANICSRFIGVLMLTAGTYKVVGMQDSGGSLVTELQHSYDYTTFASFTYLGV